MTAAEVFSNGGLAPGRAANLPAEWQSRFDSLTSIVGTPGFAEAFGNLYAEYLDSLKATDEKSEDWEDAIWREPQKDDTEAE